MVYGGKPSRGCQTCKDRRIKCDEGRPHCQKCKRAHRKCPGFLNEIDLIFRHENPEARRHGNVRTSSAASNGRRTIKIEAQADDDHKDRSIVDPQLVALPERACSALDHSDHRHVGQNQAPSEWPGYRSPARHGRNVTIGQQAALYLVPDSVPLPQNEAALREFLDNTLRKFHAVKQDVAVLLATEAVALSLCAGGAEQKDAAEHAAQSYGKALSAICEAMQDPTRATSDATLLSILLFALYESIVLGDHAASTVAKHIEGAVAIVRARGVQHFEEAQALLLFDAVRNKMLTDMAQLRQPSPLAVKQELECSDSEDLPEFEPSTPSEVLGSVVDGSARHAAVR